MAAKGQGVKEIRTQEANVSIELFMLLRNVHETT